MPFPVLSAALADNICSFYTCAALLLTLLFVPACPLPLADLGFLPSAYLLPAPSSYSTSSHLCISRQASATCFLGTLWPGLLSRCPSSTCVYPYSVWPVYHLFSLYFLCAHTHTKAGSFFCCRCLPHPYLLPSILLLVCGLCLPCASLYYFSCPICAQPWQEEEDGKLAFAPLPLAFPHFCFLSFTTRISISPVFVPFSPAWHFIFIFGGICHHILLCRPSFFIALRA